jgi:predicted DNA-binding protein
MAKLQARITDSLDARLNDAAKKVGWSKSDYVRYLLETALGDDARMSALNQVIWQINARLQRRIADVGDIVKVELEKILLEPGDDE